MKKLQSEREFYLSLGRMMRKMRKRTNMSPYYVGRLLGVHGVLYAEMEKGNIPPTPYQVYRLIHLCDIERLKDWE